MIELKEIYTADADLYAYVEQLMVSTFPANEYRPLDELRTMTDHQQNFHMNVLLDSSAPIGLLAYWSFEPFYYIEYFATDSRIRNKGYGSRALQTFCQQIDKPVILEIELPDTELSARRKAFYERNHFTTWRNDYFQPPFRPGDGLLPIMLCCYGPLNPDIHFTLVKQTLHTQVYHYHE